jgi:hypothetical protein
MAHHGNWRPVRGAEAAEHHGGADMSEGNQMKPNGPAAEIPLELQLEARSIEAELAKLERDTLSLYAERRELSERLEKAMDKMKARVPNGGQVVFDATTLRYVSTPPPIVSLPPQLARRRTWMRG